MLGTFVTKHSVRRGALMLEDVIFYRSGAHQTLWDIPMEHSHRRLIAFCTCRCKKSVCSRASAVDHVIRDLVDERPIFENIVSALAFETQTLVGVFTFRKSLRSVHHSHRPAARFTRVA